MSFQSTPYTELLVFSGVVTGGLCVYAIAQYRNASRNRLSLAYFAILMLAGTGWSLSYAIGLAAVEVPMKEFWLILTNVWTTIAPTAWLAFALAYTNNDKYLNRRTAVALSVEPIVVTLSVVTFRSHDLYYTITEPTTAPGFRILSRELGPLFVLHAAYSYLVVIFGAWLFFRFVRLDQHDYRGQAVLLVGGSLLPVLSNALFVFDVFGGWVNMTPVALGIAGIGFAIAIRRYRFFDLAPVARETVVERMRDGYVVCDDDGTVVDRNPAASRLLGVDADLVGTELATLVPEIQSALETAADGAETRTELVVDDQSVDRFLDVTVMPLEAVYGTLVVLRDITDRRRTERRFQSLIEQSSDVITVLDEAGVVDYVSPSLERVLGFDPDVAVGTSVFDLVHPADEAMTRETFETLVTTEGSIDRIEYRVPNADGEWRVHEGVGRNLLDDPDVEGIVINSRDVTDRKEREREIEAANAELEATNAELEATNAELEATNAELEATNERLQRFASVVSHDLRNPLNVADGYAELLDDRYDDPEVDEIRTSHERMRRIIEDVLELARGGDTVTDREAISLAAVAQQAWATVDTENAALETTDATVVADRSRLVRALENLFRNSVEHGGANVTVAIGSLEDGFVVADDGPGIPTDVAGSLFEEGVSGDAGTGLGLAIVEDIVDGHGWRVRTVDADGARFEFVADESRVLAGASRDFDTEAAEDDGH